MEERFRKFIVGRTVQSAWLGPLGLLALTFSMFGGVLFSAQKIVVSRAGTDLYLYFVYARQFGFEQLRAGNLALWNPHVFAGTPFLGNFQSALLYPINWIHLFLPLDKAINLEVALHVFLTGLWMYFWTLNRGLHRLACFTAAAMWMFGAPYFLKVYAGHLAPLAAMCWIPLLLLSIDWIFSGRTLAGVLLGAFAAAMQILAGHPQTVYNTAIAVAVYGAIQLLRNPRRLQVTAAIAGFYLAAAALAAVQIMTGLQVAAESARAVGGVPLDFARMFSLPPEDFLTLLVPGFFGDLSHLNYWGRAYLWETSLFMGISGFALAVYAVARAPRPTRRFWIPLVVLWLLALGGYTPLFDLLYHWLPGFNKFRGHSKFIVPAGAFLAMLAAHGLDSLLRAPQRSRAMFAATLACGVAFVSVGIVLSSGFNSAWQSLLLWMGATGETYIAQGAYADPRFAAATGNFAGWQLMLAGVVCLLLSSFWLQTRRWQPAPHFLAALVVFEVMVFAWNSCPTFPLQETQPRDVQNFLAARPAGNRILNIDGGNSGMAIGADDIWGYDPIVPRRTMAFMAWSQGLSASEVNSANVRFTSSNRLYGMLRARYVVAPGKEEKQFGELEGTLPHLLLLHDYAVIQNRERIFDAMKKSSFDPSRTVILEAEPQPKPVKSAQSGTTRVVEHSSDWMTIEAETPQPAILLITDSYSESWKATALPGSSQLEYSVLPANYILRAIPLQAGKHRIRLEYAPRAFQIGKWVSVLALLLYATVLGWFWKARFANRTANHEQNIAPVSGKRRHKSTPE